MNDFSVLTMDNYETNYVRKIVSFNLNSPEADTVKNDIEQGWFIVHLSAKGKNFIGILEKNFISPDIENNPILYIPPRKNINWLT